MQDERLAVVASVLTIAAIADTVIPTPEDWFPIIGWLDEAVLWGLAIRSWIGYIKGESLEDVISRWWD